MTNELLPCPFCGEIPNIKRIYSPPMIEISCGNSDNCFILPAICRDCPCKENEGDTPTFTPLFDQFEPEIIKVWNTRAAEPRDWEKEFDTRFIKDENFRKMSGYIYEIKSFIRFLLKSRALDIQKVKDTILEADLDFNKQPCIDDEFNAHCCHIAEFICERFGAPCNSAARCTIEPRDWEKAKQRLLQIGFLKSDKVLRFSEDKQILTEWAVEYIIDALHTLNKGEM